MRDVQNVMYAQNKALILTITCHHPHHSVSVGQVGHWDGEGAGEPPYAPVSLPEAQCYLAYPPSSLDGQ